MSQPESWITTVDAVRAFRDQLDAEGRKLVFTNGCFDLLHAGHVRYLRQARALGDALIVALNSDASVRALKGDSRPINTQEDRAEILMALQSVNGVLVFDEPRVTSLIERIQPHMYAKGGDYTLETLNPEEKAALEEAGATISLLPLVPGRSTTGTIERMQQAPEPAAPEPASAPAEPFEFGAPPAEPTAPAPTPASPKTIPGPRITARGAALSIQSRTPSASAPQHAPPLRIGILGSGQGTNFDAILRAISEGSLHAEITVVLSDVEEAPILARAREAGLQAIFVDPGDNPRVLPAHAQEEIHAHLVAHHVQVVVLTGFMRVLKDPVLSVYRDRVVNVHPSLLPKFKGREAWVQALEEGEFETGCTVHLVNAQIDSGLILDQAVVPIDIADTPETLLQRIQAEEHRLLPKVLNEWRERGLPV